jgi:replicative DNA helicase
VNARSPLPDHGLPAVLDAEQALLGALLLNEDALAYVNGILEARHFAEDLHARIYSSMLELSAAGRKVTLISVGAELADVQLPDGAPPVRAYLARLAAEATTIVNARDYAEMIVDAWARRELIAIAGAAAEQARVPGVGGLQTTLDELDAQLVQLRNDAAPSDASGGGLLGGVGAILDNIEAVQRGDALPIPTSGFIDIDRRLAGGLRRGRLIVLGGRPGMGKTLLEIAMARRTAKKGFGSMIFSLEIDREEITARMIANALGASTNPLDYRDIVSGEVPREDIPRIREMGEKIAALPIEVDAASGLKMAQIEARAKRVAMKLERKGRRLDVVMIDYLGLIDPELRKSDNLTQALGRVVLGAKNMAKRLDICVVLFAQLNRDVEKRDNKRPLMSDLRESGNIEEHADAVGLLYRPAYYDAKDPRMARRDDDFIAEAERRANELEIIWDKNRLGPTGSDFLYCDVGRNFVDNGERKW